VLSEIAGDEAKVRFFGFDFGHNSSEPLAARLIDIVKIVDHDEAETAAGFAEGMSRPKPGREQRSGAETPQGRAAAAMPRNEHGAIVA